MFKILKNTEEIAEAIAAILFALLERQSKESIHIALSGGNTPRHIFTYLNEKYGKALCNHRFHFWWGDERCVPPNSNESNYKMAYDLWLKPTGIPIGNIHRIWGENAPETEAIRYENELKKHVPIRNGFPVIDLNILGLGEDGHTASIFPGNLHLFSTDKWCAVAEHPETKQKRITLTGKVLNNANMIVFLSTGANKSRMVKNVAIDKVQIYPASHIQPGNGLLTWLLDKEAAALIDK
jgi:6-phosphogluconolactonase